MNGAKNVRVIELVSLSEEGKTDLISLVHQFISANNGDLQADIAKTIKEIIMPETMRVQLEKEFDLN